MNNLPIGYPRRDTDFDVFPGFQSPPSGYGEVAFYWWMGEPLTRERLTWQLNQLTRRGISGLQINYAHSDLGGLTWGLSYPSTPPLFSGEWWALFDWFVKEANQRGIAVSVSDYTLGVGQGWYLDEIGAIYPDMRGKTLRLSLHMIKQGNQLDMVLPEGWISVMAYPTMGAVLENAVDLRGAIKGKQVIWSPPASKTDWQIAIITAETVERSLDPMHPASGRETINRFFERFVDHHPDQPGKGLNFFFSDELNFRVSGKLWTGRFAEEFRRRKGYDLIPEIPALWLDLGARTTKVRLDYNDVVVTMSEEGYFKPLYEWHQRHGMMFGCDHGGRGLIIDEFGDYFRTQRWNQAPGCDQPFLQTDLIKNKVAASIAHLYERQRVWLEGFHSSGWGTSTAQLTRATLINYVHGQNLLSLHGLYYSTHGSWWEWAPPCNHFRMPYWAHFASYLTGMERLSYLLSQGVHRCDVAIFYPVAAVEAGFDGDKAVQASFELGRTLYAKGIDFDFIDFESLDRAVIDGAELTVAGERFRVLVLPSMRAVRYSTLEKAVAFQRAGGVVLLMDALPEASDRIGANDPELDRLVRELTLDMPPLDLAAVIELIRHAFPPDFAIIAATATSDEPLSVMHRHVGERDIYAVYGVTKETICYFRTHGRIELWDMWTGRTRPLYAVKADQNGMYMRVPLTENELQLIVFAPDDSPLLIDVPGLEQIEVSEHGNVMGVVALGGTYQGTIQQSGVSRTIIGTAEKPPDEMVFERTWRFELLPTLDNQWGDFRLPATDRLIGAEIRRCRYRFDPMQVGMTQGWMNSDCDDSAWGKATMGFGRQFWKLGALPNDDLTTLEASLCELTTVDPYVTVEWDGRNYEWIPYEFSWRDGIENDPGHQGYHGLKGEVHDDIIALGRAEQTHTAIARLPEACGTRYYLWTTVTVEQTCIAKVMCGGLLPSKLWIDGVPLALDSDKLTLTTGKHTFLLRYDDVGRGYCFLTEQSFNRPPIDSQRMTSRWHNTPGILPFDAQPMHTSPLGWYRFESAPGLRALTFRANDKAKLWIDGQECALEIKEVDAGTFDYWANLPNLIRQTAQVTICLEHGGGRYDGAAIPDPIELECEEGLLECGDWSLVDGLHTYSGGAWYRQDILLNEVQASCEAVLDLGDVISTALVRINDVTIGTRIAPPWIFDVSGVLCAGVNRVEICVYNTLANHYQTVPTRFRGDPVSGLLGAVRLKFYSRISLE